MRQKGEPGGCVAKCKRKAWFGIGARDRSQGCLMGGGGVTCAARDTSPKFKS